MNKKRDSFIFYRSFYEAISDLPDVNRYRLYDAISEYCLNFKEPDLGSHGIERTLWKLIKPQLDANNKKFIDGKKGGRPKGYKQKKPVVIETENHTLENEKPNVNENVECGMNNVNEKDEVKTKTDNEEFFNIFYSLYPLKKSKQDAFNKFKTIIKKTDLKDILEGLEKYKKHIEQNGTEPQFIKHPSTWLNQRCWEDEYKLKETYEEMEKRVLAEW